MEPRSTAGVQPLLQSSTVALNPGAARVTASHAARFCQAPHVCFDVTADYVAPENRQSNQLIVLNCLIMYFCPLK